jgi:predicted metal-dependent enzyme (double-stranded beta helix superfamily)
VRRTIITEQRILTPGPLTPGQLAAEVQRLTSSPAEWVARVRLDPEGRWYERIHMTDDFEVWLISWLPGQSTGFHDHGVSAGAFGVVWGALDESVVTRRAAAPKHGGQPSRMGGSRPPSPLAPAIPPEPRATRVAAGDVRAFGPHYVHDVQNSSTASVAVSVHAYSPPLSSMTRYNLTSGGLAAAGTEGAGDW